VVVVAAILSCVAGTITRRVEAKRTETPSIHRTDQHIRRSPPSRSTPAKPSLDVTVTETRKAGSCPRLIRSDSPITEDGAPQSSPQLPGVRNSHHSRSPHLPQTPTQRLHQPTTTHRPAYHPPARLHQWLFRHSHQLLTRSSESPRHANLQGADTFALGNEAQRLFRVHPTDQATAQHALTKYVVPFDAEAIQCQPVRILKNWATIDQMNSSLLPTSPVSQDARTSSGSAPAFQPWFITQDVPCAAADEFRPAASRTLRQAHRRRGHGLSRGSFRRRQPRPAPALPWMPSPRTCGGGLLRRPMT